MLEIPVRNDREGSLRASVPCLGHCAAARQGLCKALQPDCGFTQAQQMLLRAGRDFQAASPAGASYTSFAVSPSGSAATVDELKSSVCAHFCLLHSYHKSAHVAHEGSLCQQPCMDQWHCLGMQQHACLLEPACTCCGGACMRLHVPVHDSTAPVMQCCMSMALRHRQRAYVLVCVVGAAIEAKRPIGNYTVGQATQAIIEGIAVQPAGTNCSVWVEEGVQCGGLVRRQCLLSAALLPSPTPCPACALHLSVFLASRPHSRMLSLPDATAQ